jgi:hypothetical protein
MSADNRICIMQDSYGSWRVWMGSLSFEYHTPPSYSLDAPSRDAAEVIAERMAEETDILEGGIEFISKEEQSRALQEEIKHLANRLGYLSCYDFQWVDESPIPVKPVVSEKWDCHKHKDELRVTAFLTIFHPDHGQLCLMKNHQDCLVFHPIVFESHQQACEWIREGSIADLQAKLCTLAIQFSKKCVLSQKTH